MNSSKTWLAWTQRGKSEEDGAPRRFLHRFSDSGLHTTLMVAIVAIVALTLVQAVTMGVAVWQLDTVVVQGQAKR